MKYRNNCIVVGKYSIKTDMNWNCIYLLLAYVVLFLNRGYVRCVYKTRNLVLTTLRLRCVAYATLRLLRVAYATPRLLRYALAADSTHCNLLFILRT